MMRIGVLSDTHGHWARTEQAVRVFLDQAVDLVIHCGDVGSSEVVALFDPWPTHFVFGNVDAPGELRPVIQRAGKTCHERLGTLELEGRRIAFLHSDDRPAFLETISDGRFDLVCFGHTHAAELFDHGSTKVLNPGAVYRSPRPSVAIVVLPELQITHVAI
jgi:putative phosphoesterase